jgi:hypothetical protein
MIDRLILSAVLGTVGWNGLFPDPPTPLTTQQLMLKAKEASVSQVCQQKKKSKELKKLCKRWGRHE